MNNVSVLKLAGIACGALGTIFGICMCAADFVSGGPNVFGAINLYRYAAITTNLLGGLPTANTLTVPLTYSFDSVLARAQVCAAFAVFALVTFIAATVIGALTITGYLPDLMRYGMPAFHILAAGSSLIYFSTAYSIYNDTASFYAAGGGPACGVVGCLVAIAGAAASIMDLRGFIIPVDSLAARPSGSVPQGPSATTGSAKQMEMEMAQAAQAKV